MSGPEADGVTRLPRSELAPGASFNFSDAGNARRLALLYGRELRWSATERTWLTWTGAYWRRDETGEVMRRAKAMVATIYADAAVEPDEARRRAVSQHALKSESLRSLQAAVELLKSEPGIAVGLNDLDRDPYALNVHNGTLGLKGAATLRPHDPADLITRIIPVDYDPAATAPTWLAVLERIFGGRRALIQFMQRAAGYALTGDTREQCVFILHGSARTERAPSSSRSWTCCGSTPASSASRPFWRSGRTARR